MVNFLRLVFLFLMSCLSFAHSSGLEKCEWNNSKGIPCITIKATPNTSSYSEGGIIKQIITKKDTIDRLFVIDFKLILHHSIKHIIPIITDEI